MSTGGAHPAVAGMDVAVAARRFHASLTGGAHWDDLMVSLRPETADCGSEHAAYTLDACVEEGLVGDDDVDPTSPEGVEALRLWCERRAPACAERIAALPVVDGHVRAHRMIAVSDPAELRPALGVFWTHDFENWPDPYPLWAEGGRDAPTIVVEALVPVEAVDWQSSLMCLMDWFLGDCEAELRVRPGFPVRIVSAFRLDDDTPVDLPELEWTT